MQKTQMGQMLDISDPNHGVQVEIRADKYVLWVSVDGVTVLRVCGIKPGMLSVDRRVEREMCVK